LVACCSISPVVRAPTAGGERQADGVIAAPHLGSPRYGIVANATIRPRAARGQAESTRGLWCRGRPVRAPIGR
jgi:hypothetical protein